MCGRARLSSDVSEIKLAFRIPPQRPTPNFASSWNVAPSDRLPMVRNDAKDDQRSLEMMGCGLVPFWSKDIKVGFANVNANAEGIEKKPAFHEAFQQRHCLVPVDIFLRVEKDRDQQSTPGARAQGRRPDGASGDLALAHLRRTRAQLCGRHHGAERAAHPIA